MATGNIESWGGNIADIGPLYPFVGSEFALFIVALLAWIVFHVIQAKSESNQYKEQASKYAGKPVHYDDDY